MRQRQLLARHHGVLEEAFAFCLTLPLDDFNAQLEPLHKCGYRPTLARPFYDGTRSRVSAIWARDGGEFHWEGRLSKDELTTLDRELNGRLWPVDVSCYSPGENVYAALWNELDDSPKTQIYLDKSQDELPEYLRLMQQGGWYSHRIHQYVSQSGPLFCGILSQHPSRRTILGSGVNYGPAQHQARYFDEVLADASAGWILKRMTTRAADVARSLQQAEAQLRTNSTDTRALFTRAWGRFYSRQYDQALSDFNRLLAPDPDNIQYLLFRSRCWAKLRCKEAAYADLSQIKKGNPRQAEAEFMESLLLEEFGDLAAAEALLAAAVDKAIPDKSQLYNLACAYAQLADLVPRESEDYRRLCQRTNEAMIMALNSGIVSVQVATDPDFLPMENEITSHRLVKWLEVVEYAGVWHHDPAFETRAIVCIDADRQYPTSLSFCTF